MRIRRIQIFCLIAMTSIGYGYSQNITGIVFEDINKNQIFDVGDIPLKNVVVTNQLETIVTNEEGIFNLPLIEENFISVTKPKGYQFLLDAKNKPKSYFYYQPNSIKDSLKYSGAKASEYLPKELLFPMTRISDNKHRALLVGDPQMSDDKRLGYFKEGLLPFMALENADFRITLGDIADDYLDILAKELESSSTMGQVGYYVFGNHDINYKAKDTRYATATFKKVYGPEYYSFDYGSFHYIVLNTVKYDGWNFSKNKRGSYFGGIDKEQFTWLKNDLKYVSPDKIIVVCTHIPILENFTKKEDVDSIFKLLSKNNKVFAVSAHMHTVQAYEKENTSYKIDGLNAGATCGAWWLSPKDELGIPYATSTDGTPKGYFVMDVDDTNYDYKYKTVNYPDNFQMRIYQEKDSLLVNWFVGKKSDKVKGYIKNSDIEIKFTNTTGKDPFTAETLSSNKNDDNWTPGIATINHLWQAEVPKGLKKGFYGLEIEATNYKGKKFSGFKIIEIE